MSFCVWTEIVCKDCASSLAGQFSRSVIRRKDLSMEAKSKGGTLIQDEWFCHKCYERQIKQPPGTFSAAPSPGGET